MRIKKQRTAGVVAAASMVLISVGTTTAMAEEPVLVASDACAEITTTNAANLDWQLDEDATGTRTQQEDGWLVSAPAGGLQMEIGYFDTPIALKDFSAEAPELVYSSDNASTTVASQLRVSLDGDVDSWGILVNVPSVYDSAWWASPATVKEINDNSIVGAPTTKPGGSAYSGAWEDWTAAFPNAKVLGYGYYIGADSTAVVEKITYGCNEISFAEVSPTFTVTDNKVTANGKDTQRVNINLGAKGAAADIKVSLAPTGATVGKITAAADGTTFFADITAAKEGTYKVTVTYKGQPVAAEGNDSAVFAKVATEPETPNVLQGVGRLSGEDRYDTSVDVAAKYIKPGNPVFIAAGADFADALSVSPAVAKSGGVLLLVGDSVSQSAKDLLTKNAPKQIYIAGGPNTVSNAVLSELSKIAPTTRVFGTDRYATSVKVNDLFFKDAKNVFLANGLDYPDALTVGAAAGSADVPLYLVPQGASALPKDIKDRVAKDTVVSIAGGPKSVSASIADDAKAATGKAAVRYAGEDRYDTANAINAKFFPEATDNVFIASGEVFPDALVASWAAGTNGEPVYLARLGCTPKSVADEISARESDQIVLVGGPATLSNVVSKLVACK